MKCHCNKHSAVSCSEDTRPVVLCLCPQIECSSISEYSEKIIKSNHLHNGKPKWFSITAIYRKSICLECRAV